MAVNILGLCSENKFVFSRFFPLINKFYYNCNSKPLHLSNCLLHGEYEWQDPKSSDEIVNITYIDRDGKETSVKGKVGDNLMYLAHRYGIPMEGRTFCDVFIYPGESYQLSKVDKELHQGACEASLACTTCHVYVLGDFFEKLPSPEEKEEDLLDMAPFLKENSRLGCQMKLTKDLDGMKVQLPKGTRNFYVDGHQPKPH